MSIEISKQIRQLAGMTKALQDLADLADQVNGQDQYEAEHAARLAELAKQERELAQAIAAKQEAMLVVERQMVAVVEDAKVEAAGIVTKAKRLADDLVRDAERQAEQQQQVFKAAKAKADEHQTRGAALFKEASALEEQVAAAKAVIAKAEAIKAAMGG